MKKIIILILILTSYKSKSQCLSGDCNNGYGQYQYGNGGIYQGNFKNGLENGSGTLILASGAKYIGEFSNGKKNGKGIYYYTSGEIQDGDFVNGNFVNGKDKLASGDTYIGEFLNGVWNGNGTYIWADGEKYVGGFKNGVFHGIGKKYLINGNIVEGEWSNGTMIKKTVQNTATTNTSPSEDINCELARKKYLEQNPDVAKAGMDAWNHYTTFGKREGRKWPACAENAKNSNYTSDYDFGINTITYAYSGNSQSGEFYVKKQILMSSLSYLSVNFLDHVDITQKELKKKELARMCELLYKKFPILKQEVLDMYFSTEQQNKYNNATVPEIYAVLAEVFCIDNNSFNKSVWSKLPIKIDGVALNNKAGVALKTNSTNLPTKKTDEVAIQNKTAAEKFAEEYYRVISLPTEDLLKLSTCNKCKKKLVKPTNRACYYCNIKFSGWGYVWDSSSGVTEEHFGQQYIIECYPSYNYHNYFGWGDEKACHSRQCAKNSH